jgi:hypothetical protein
MNFAETANSSANVLTVILIGAIQVALTVLLIIAAWKMFKKAHQAGWKVLIPIYNFIVLLKIAGRPWWWLILYFVPLLNLIILLIISLDIAKAFGRSKLFGIFGLFIFSAVGVLILGFGDAKYVGPSKPATAS